MADRLHLLPKHREALEALLREHLPDVEAWAYGSRVNGRSHDGSDLDLVLRGPELTEIPLDQLADFEEAVRESNIPFLVEARDWARLSERFHREIERGYVRLRIENNQCAIGDDPKEDHEVRRTKVTPWKTASLGEVADLNWGDTKTTKKSYSKTGFTAYSASGPDGLLPYADYERTGVVLSAIGSDCGKTWLAKGKWSCIKNTIRFFSKIDEVDTEFLYWITRDPEYWPRRGSGQPFISQGDARACMVQFPSLPQQRAIAHILGTLDDKIELNRRMNETLEAMARAIFKDWFVDFGPTRAKVEGRDPYLTPEIWDLFPDALDGEGKPVGWEKSEIGKEVEVVGGATPSTKESIYWKQGEHHWVTPKDLSKLQSPVLLDTDRRITDAGVKKISSGLLPMGTVLLSSRAPVGYLAIAEVQTAVNQGFIAMICRKRLPNIFVLFWCYENLDHIKNISSGSTFAEISKKAFRSIPVTIPSERILSFYDNLISRFYNRIVVNTKDTVSLAQTRDLSLPKLMLGEVRVEDKKIRS